MHQSEPVCVGQTLPERADAGPAAETARQKVVDPKAIRSAIGCGFCPVIRASYLSDQRAGHEPFEDAKRRALLVEHRGDGDEKRLLELVLTAIAAWLT